MSRFTTEVRYICETMAGYDESQGYARVEDIIEEVAPDIFGDFPIYDEAYRLPLEVKILRHYYTREISEETVGLWKLRLNDMMNIIMPYYNKLYNSELLKFNPFYDVDLTRDYQRKDNGATIDSGSENSKEKYKRNVGEIENGTENELGKELNKGGETTSEIENETAQGKASSKGDSTSLTNEVSAASEDRTGTAGGTSKSNSSTIGISNSGSDSWNLYNDTPQGGVNGLMAIGGPGGIADSGSGYLTNARHEFETNNGEDTSASSGTNQSESNEETKAKSEGSKLSSGAESFTNENKNDSTRNRGASRVVARDGGRNTQRDNTRQNARSIAEETGKDNSKINSNESLITNLSEYIEHVVGKQGTASYSKMLMEFRDTFLNIDRMIIKELSPLFFGLWE